MLARTFDEPVAYDPSDFLGILTRDWPVVNRLRANQPALNVLGENVNMSRAPLARQLYPRRNDPMWQAVGKKAQQGVFIPAITHASVTDPATGRKRKMTEAEEYRYKAEVYKRMGDVMRYNYTWFRYAEPEAAQRWLDRTSRQIRQSVRGELNLR